MNRYFQKLFNVQTRLFARIGVSDSTIYALATGSVRSPLAVIRVSGPATKLVLSKIGHYSDLKDLPEPRRMTLRTFIDNTSNTVIDKGMLVWFNGPKSFTGEDCCEFHVHGGVAVITALLHSINKIPYCRPAEPGEFTRRAFLNGKMDLTAVEGLSDLINAETEIQRLQAINQLEGSLGSLYESWRKEIAKCVAHVEAFIDFGEDENIEDGVLEQVEDSVVGVSKEIERHVQDSMKGQRLRDGVRVVLLGEPNVGKSSLLNILSRKNAAIVSAIPGTTRDVIESCCNINGYPVVFVDTAGVHKRPDNEIEAEGIKRSLMEARQADLVLLVVDTEKFEAAAPVTCNKVEDPKKHESQMKREMMKKVLNFGEEEAGLLNQITEKSLTVVNKIDLWNNTWNSEYRKKSSDRNICYISCKNKDGIDSFVTTLADRIRPLCSNPKTEAPSITRERYRSNLINCVRDLQKYLESTDCPDLAIKVQYLRNALNSIGYITGHSDTEQILDIIFKDFCIGK